MFSVITSMYVCRFQNVVLRSPTPRLHRFLSSQWPSFRFLSFMAFLLPSIQFFFGLPRALFCFGIHFNAILGNLPSAILWTWPHHVSWLYSISFIIRSSNPICCLIVTFLILSFLDILEDLVTSTKTFFPDHTKMPMISHSRRLPSVPLRPHTVTSGTFKVAYVFQLGKKTHGDRGEWVGG